MEQIGAIGFDMDWTLAQYNDEFDLLAFEGAKVCVYILLLLYKHKFLKEFITFSQQKLVQDLGYPEEVLSFVYSQTAYRRGFVIDKKRGNILKLDQVRYFDNLRACKLNFHLCY